MHIHMYIHIYIIFMFMYTYVYGHFQAGNLLAHGISTGPELIVYPMAFHHGFGAKP